MSSSAPPVVIIETPHGPQTIPRDQFLAIVRNAEYQADLTAATLREMGLPIKNLRLPGNFLLELGAVVQLHVWERRGLTPHLKGELPAAKVASKELVERVQKGASEFEGNNAAPLSRQVLQVGIEQFAWNGQELLQADVVVGDVDEDEFVALLAEFLWTHRACLPISPRKEQVES